MSPYSAVTRTGEMVRRNDPNRL